MGFFDDVVKGINSEINKVQTRGQEMLQTYQFNSQIRHLEGKKAAVLVEIGKLIYDKYQRNMDVSEEQLLDKTREIVGYEHEIAALQSELEVLKAQSDPDRPASEKAESKAGYTQTPGFQCPHCQAPACAEKSFCPSCGGKLKTEVEV